LLIAVKISQYDSDKNLSPFVFIFFQNMALDHMTSDWWVQKWVGRSLEGKSLIFRERCNLDHSSAKRM